MHCVRLSALREHPRRPAATGAQQEPRFTSTTQEQILEKDKGYSLERIDHSEEHRCVLSRAALL